MRTSGARVMRGFLAAVAIGATAFGAITTSALAAPAHGNPLAKLTADQIAAKAISDLKSASSFHFYQAFKFQGQRFTVSLSISHRGCTGDFALGGFGSAAFLEVSSTVYERPDDQMWKFYGVPAADLGTVHGKWLDVTAALGGNPGGPNEDVCSTKKLATTFGLQSKNLVKGKTTRVAGHPALQLKAKKGLPSYYVTISSTPEFLTANSKQQGPWVFSAYGAKVNLTVPPASEILKTLPTGTGPASINHAVRALLIRG